MTIKELIGYSDIAMTMRYRHKQWDVKRDDIERMTEHILGGDNN